MTARVTAEHIYAQIQDLPQASLDELERYVEFLHFKNAKSDQSRPPIHIRDLEGILEGYDFSPDVIAEARREMWPKFYEDEP